MDPGGCHTSGLPAVDNARGMSPQQLSEVSMQRSAEVFRSQDGLVLLVDDTGGLFLHDTNDIDGAVRQVMDDSAGYYLIGYHPDASTFNVKTGEPKFHRISVRVKVAGLHARSRKGFFGT